MKQIKLDETSVYKFKPFYNHIRRKCTPRDIWPEYGITRWTLAKEVS